MDFFTVCGQEGARPGAAGSPYADGFLLQVLKARLEKLKKIRVGGRVFALRQSVHLVPARCIYWLPLVLQRMLSVSAIARY